MFNELTIIFSLLFSLLLVVFFIVGLIKPALFNLSWKNVIIIFLIGCIIPLFFFIRIYFLYENYRNEINFIIEENQERLTETRTDAYVALYGEKDRVLAIEIINEAMEEILNDIEKMEQIDAPKRFDFEDKKKEAISAFGEQYNFFKSMEEYFSLKEL